MTGLGFGEEETRSVATEFRENALLCALDDCHVVVTETKQEKDGELGLGILDLKFNTVKAWTDYPVGTKSAPIYLTVLNTNLVLGVDSGVHQCQCSVTLSTLGSVLGSMVPSKGISAQRSSNLETLIEPLLDRSKTKDYKSFKSAFCELFTAVKENGDETVLIQRQLNALVKRCLAEKHFFPQKELLRLISESLVPANLCMDTIKKLQDNDDLAGVHSCLIHIKDIPESVVVQCLQYFLAMDASKFPSVLDGEMTDAAEEEDDGKNRRPFPEGKAAFVNRALMIPFNEVFLLENLKKLEFDKCVELLEYLG